MSRNISQIYVDNPAITMSANDLLYLGRSPYGAINDMAITWDNLMGSITKVGTITTGVWNGTIITGTYGGTGVNNGTKTITLGGNLTTIGAFNSTFNFTGLTNVTFPTSGTLSTTTGTVTSITAGSNLTGGTITTSGTIALSATVAGLTTLEVAGTNLSAGFITATSAGITIATLNASNPVVLSPNGSFVALTDFGLTTATTLRFYNAAATHYIGLKTTNGLVADTTFTLPTADGTSGQVLQTNGSGQLSFVSNGSGTVTSITAGTNLTGGTITTSGTIALASTLVDLTAMNIGAALGTGTGINISANLITNISVNDLVIYPQGGHNLNLSPTLSGAVQLIDGTSTIAVPLRWYNIAGTNYIGFKAGTLSGSTTFTLPTADGSAGYVMTTDGAGNLSFSQSVKTLFNAFLTSMQTNVTGDGTVVTLGAMTEVTDRNNDFNGATQTFTASVTGDYCFLPNVFLAGIGALHTNINIMIVTTGTSAGTYYPVQALGIGTAALSGGVAFSGAYIIHMTAGDTAQLQAQVSGSTKTVSINAGSAMVPTCFQGYLIP